MIHSHPRAAIFLKISIITAVYNSEATVGEAIASVARQRFPGLEHVIIEGKSKDNSLDAVYRAGHDRMVVFSEADKGIYDALNKGIARATGDVIGLVHSDDYLADDGVLQRIADAFSDPAVEAIFGDLDYVARENTSHVIRHWSTGPFHPRRLRRGWMPAHPTLYLRRAVFERMGTYDTGFQIAADYDFILRYFSQTQARPVYIPEVLYKMRVGGVSNRSLSKIFHKTREDYTALRRNRVGGIFTLAAKNLSKLGQFAVKQSNTP